MILLPHLYQRWEHRYESALTNEKKNWIKTGLGFGKVKQKEGNPSDHVSFQLCPDKVLKADLPCLS